MRSSSFGNGDGPEVPEGPHYLNRRKDDTLLAQVRAYWEGLRQADALPQRAQLDPRGIEDALTSSFLLERVAPGIARFRIAGTHLSELIGMDIRGMPLTACFEPSARPVLMQDLEAVFARPARLELDLEAARGIGKPPLEARLLILPLCNDQDEISLALGCLASSGAVGRAPRRFYIARRHLSPIQTHSGPPTAVQTAQKPHAASLGFAESAPPYIPPRAAPGRAHLRLVKSDK